MSATTLVRILSMMHPDGAPTSLHPDEVRLMMAPDPNTPSAGNYGRAFLVSPSGPTVDLWFAGAYPGSNSVAGFRC